MIEFVKKYYKKFIQSLKKARFGKKQI